MTGVASSRKRKTRFLKQFFKGGFRPVSESEHRPVKAHHSIHKLLHILFAISVIGEFKKHEDTLIRVDDLHIHGGLGSDFRKIDIDVFHIKGHLISTVPVILLIYEDEMIICPYGRAFIDIGIIAVSDTGADLLGNIRIDLTHGPVGGKGKRNRKLPEKQSQLESLPL